MQNSQHFYLKTTQIFYTYIELTQIRLKPKSSKSAHFSIKIYHNLQFTTTPQNQTTSSLQYHILILLPNFVQISILLKYSQMTNQTFVPLLFRTPPNMLQHNLQDILDISNFQSQMKNLKSLILTL